MTPGVNPPTGSMSGAAVLCRSAVPTLRLEGRAPWRRPSSVGSPSVSSKSGRKEVFDVTLSLQVLAFLTVALILTGSIGFAVLRWLESTS